MTGIYFDHSATTPVDPLVLQAMNHMLTEGFGNPSSLHGFGRQAREAVEKARTQVAALIGSRPQEIIFTSGGTEADNMAIIGGVQANASKGRHVITSAIEHHAVLHAVEHLQKQGYPVTILPVDGYGRVDPQAVREAIRPDTVLISIMHANNEIGTVQPIAEIGKIAREKGVLFHVDAVQTAGRIPIDVDELGIDLLSLSAHKFYGPKGVGALYIRKGTKVTPRQHGGGQERKLRSGTENVPGIVGLGRAAELAKEAMPARTRHLAELSRRLITGVLDEIPDSMLTGHPTDRLPGHTSFVFRGVEGESMLLLLDKAGIAASTGSACASGSLDPSHVLLAIGLQHEVAHGSLRLTLGQGNTSQEVDRLLEVLPVIVARLREMSPLYQKRGAM